VLPDPGGRQTAPEPLRLVQAFVNTLDIENEVDELSGPAALDEILVRIGAAEEPLAEVTDDDVRRALELREALRRILLVNNGCPAEPAARRTVERAARNAHLGLRFGELNRARLVAEAPGVDGALGRIVAVAFTAMADGSWERLKACRRDICHWVFYDRSKNRSSHWCSMLVCGNRTKSQRYRRRAAA
jgi:predicted RNA-binding Zn ribbon-like protein